MYSTSEYKSFQVLCVNSMVTCFIIGLCHQESEFDQAFIIVPANGHLRLASLRYHFDTGISKRLNVQFVSNDPDS